VVRQPQQLRRRRLHRPAGAAAARADTDTNAYFNSDSYSNANCYSYSDRHSNCNRDSYGHSYGHGHSYSHSYGYRNSYGYSTAQSDAFAKASWDSATAAVVSLETVL
jgi:hypothetical protein